MISFLQRVALFARHRYRHVFWVTGLLVVLSLIGASRLRFDTEILNMLPQDDPVVQRFRETLEEFGSLDFLLIVVRLPEDAVVDPYLDFVDVLGSRLEQLPEIQTVDYRIGPIGEIIEDVLPQALLFLDERGRAEVETRLTAEAIKRHLLELKRQLSTPQALALKELLLLDPFGIADVFIDRLMNRRGDLKIDWSKGYFLSSDRSLVLLVARPIEPAQEIEFDRRLIGAVRGTVAGALAEWKQISAGDDHPPPGVDLGGTYVTALEDAGSLFHDITINIFTSAFGVLLLFTFAFRRISLVLYALFPLLVGLILAFGFASVTVGTLNAATSGFAALLVGLGIDFVIVSYGRYVEARQRGADLSQGLREMTGSSGRAVVTGGVTTAATFLAFMVTKFQGLRQMGFLVAVGIVFCMISVLVLLPAMLAWREDHPAGIAMRRFFERLFGRSVSESEQPRLFVHGFGSERLVAWCYRHPKPVLATGALITLVAAFLAPRLEFIDSIRSMRPEGNRGVLVQDEVGEKFGSGFDYMMAVVSAPSETLVLERTAEAEAHLRPLVDDGVLRGIDTVGNILPTPGHQAEALDWLRANRAVLLRPQRLEQAFAQGAEEAGLRTEPFAKGLRLFALAAAADKPVDLSALGRRQETQRLLARYLHRVGDDWRSVLYLYPPPRVWKREAPPEVVRAVNELGDDVMLTGVNTVSERLRTQVKSDAVVAAGLGFVLVALLLWADYRKLSLTVLSLAPLCVGIVWMLGGMVVLGVSMNFFNVFVTTMIIGIGVDYGIHIVHRYTECRATGDDSGLLSGLQETSKAIVLAALSTSVGFGSMAISHYPGLRSMGFVAILGALATALVSITLLPAFLSMRVQRRPLSHPRAGRLSAAAGPRGGR